MTAFDLFVIGGGSGGVRAARIAARNGARAGLAEQDRIGGTCVIRGCVPKKLMAFAARFRDEFEDSVAFGWSPAEHGFDWRALSDSLDREVDRLNAAYRRGLESAGVTIFPGRAVIDGPIFQTSFPSMRHQFAGRDENVLLKLIVDADTDRLLGCHILGSNAAELVQLVAIAVRMGATKGDLDATMALHPTVAEELVTMREPKKRYRRAAAE